MNFPLSPFIQQLRHPYVYYRFEQGHRPNLMIEQEFFPVSPSEVFDIFCFPSYSPGQHPVRLVFNDLDNYSHWVWANTLRRGTPFTVVEILTNKPLPLAEDYTARVQWYHERTGEMREGCPYLAMQQQGVLGKEYVVQPEDIVEMALFFGEVA